MIIEVKIDLGIQKPLLFSYNLSFIKVDPDHPRLVRFLYNAEFKTLKIESIQFGRKDIIIEERHQKVSENCDGWERSLTMYTRNQPQLLDQLFYDNNDPKVRTYRNLDMRDW